MHSDLAQRGTGSTMLAAFLQQHDLLAWLAKSTRDSVLLVDSSLQQSLLDHKPINPQRVATLSQALELLADGVAQLIILTPSLSASDRQKLHQHFAGLRQLSLLRDIYSQSLIDPGNLKHLSSQFAGPKKASKGLSKPAVIVLGNGGIEMDFFVDQLRLAGLGVPRRYVDDLHLFWRKNGGQFSLSRHLLHQARLASLRGEGRMVVNMPLRLLLGCLETGLIDLETWQDYIEREDIRVIFYNNRDKISRALYAAATEDLPGTLRWQRVLGQKSRREIPKLSAELVFADMITAVREEAAAKEILSPLKHLLVITHEEFLTEPDRFMAQIGEYLEDRSLKQTAHRWTDFAAAHFKDPRPHAQMILRQLIDKLGIFVNQHGSLVNLQELIRSADPLDDD